MIDYAVNTFGNNSFAISILRLKLSIVWEEKFARFLKTASYQIMGMFIIVFIPVINKAMASWLGLGKVSLLEYAEKLYFIPQNLLSTGLIVTLLSYWSERYYSEGGKRLKKDVWKAAKAVTLISMLLTSLFLLIKNNLVTVAYGYGKFPKEQIVNVQKILGFYLVGLTPNLLIQIYAMALLTRKDTKSLLLTAFLGLIAAVILNFIFMRIFGISGIALANFFAAVSILGMLAFLFYRRQI